MYKLIYLLIIIVIVINHYFEACYVETPVSSGVALIKPVNYTRERNESLLIPPEPRIDEVKNFRKQVTINDKPEILGNAEVREFNNPKPWSKIVHNPNDEYPYYFHIKIKIPSLNDYENWKQIVPNLEFIPRSGELVIPSKDEASALALANLIVINFTGQMSLKNILEKNLIQISINKAKTHDVVKNKLREQIMETLHGKPSVGKDSYQQDLARDVDAKEAMLNFKSEGFKDTFQHFSSGVEPFSGSDYSYL